MVAVVAPGGAVSVTLWVVPAVGRSQVAVSTKLNGPVTPSGKAVVAFTTMLPSFLFSALVTPTATVPVAGTTTGAGTEGAAHVKLAGALGSGVSSTTVQLAPTGTLAMATSLLVG